MTAAEGQKLDSFRRELVRTHDKLNEMIDDKQKLCRVKSEFEKILNVIEKYEKKAQEIDTKQGNNARSIDSEQYKNAFCSDDFVKEINENLENTGKAQALGSTSAAIQFKIESQFLWKLCHTRVTSQMMTKYSVSMR